MNWRRFNPFRRKEEVSPEFSSYYQSADTNSQSNSAILLGFVTLLAAILLVLVYSSAVEPYTTNSPTKKTIKLLFQTKLRRTTMLRTILHPLTHPQTIHQTINPLRFLVGTLQAQHLQRLQLKAHQQHCHRLA